MHTNIHLLQYYIFDEDVILQNDKKLHIDFIFIYNKLF